eukprot:Opistho-2@72334
MACLFHTPPGRRWKHDVRVKLSLRNASQSESYDVMVETVTKHIEEIAALKKDNKLLQRENTQLQVEKNTLALQVDKLKEAGDVTVSSAVNARVALLEERLARAQEELMESYKHKGHNAQRVLDLNHAVMVKDEEAKKRESEIAVLQSAVAIHIRQLEDVKGTVAEKDVTIQVLQDELQALQLELLRIEERNRDLERDNKELVERWLRKMNEEAQKINDANAFIEQVSELKKTQDLRDAVSSDHFAAVASSPGGTDIQQQLMQALDSSGTLANGDGASIMSASTSSLPGADAQAVRGRRQSNVGVVVVPTTAVHRIIGHDGDVNCVQFSTNGMRIVTGGNDKKVKVWDAKTGVALITLLGATQSVMSVAFNSKDDLVMGASNDHAVRLWGVQSGRIRHTLTGHIGKVLSAKFCGDNKVVSGSHDRTIKIWDLSRGYCTRTFFTFSSCNDIAMADDDGTGIISGHLDNHVRIWDSRVGDCTNEITGIHTGQITSLDLSADRRQLLTNSRDNTLKLIDLRMFQVVNTFCGEGYRNGMNWSKACFSPDARYVAAGSQDGLVYVWNSQTLKLERQLKDHQGSVSAVAWNPQGHQIASCDKDKMWVLYE